MKRILHKLVVGFICSIVGIGSLPAKEVTVTFEASDFVETVSDWLPERYTIKAQKDCISLTFMEQKSSKDVPGKGLNIGGNNFGTLRCTGGPIVKVEFLFHDIVQDLGEKDILGNIRDEESRYYYPQYRAANNVFMDQDPADKNHQYWTYEVPATEQTISGQYDFYVTWMKVTYDDGEAVKNWKEMNNVIYDLDNPDAPAIRYTGKAGDNLITIPIYPTIDFNGTTYSVKAVADEAFLNAEGFRILDFYESGNLETIGKDAFNGCKAETIKGFPAAVTTISSGAFANMPELKEMHVTSVVPQTVADDVFTGTDTGSVKLYVPQGSEDAYLADPVWGKFRICTETRPFEYTKNADGGVTVTGFNPLEGAMVEEINVPEFIVVDGEKCSVTAIAGKAFCTEGEGWFNVRKVTLPSGLKTIGNGAFNDLKSLSTVISNSIEAPALDSPVFGGLTNPANCALVIPEGSSASYSADEEWKTFRFEKYSVAKIGDTRYETFDAAIAAALDGETVTLLDNVTLTKGYAVERNVTIDLNNRKLTDNAPGVLFNVYNATLTLTTGENGMLSASGNTAATAIVALCNAGGEATGAEAFVADKVNIEGYCPAGSAFFRFAADGQQMTLSNLYAELLDNQTEGASLVNSYGFDVSLTVENSLLLAGQKDADWLVMTAEKATSNPITLTNNVVLTEGGVVIRTSSVATTISENKFCTTGLDNFPREWIIGTASSSALKAQRRAESEESAEPAAATSDSKAIILSNSGKADIRSGEYIADHVVYVEPTGGEATISGGTLTGNVTTSPATAESVVTVTGGKVDGKVTIASGSAGYLEGGTFEKEISVADDADCEISGGDYRVPDNLDQYVISGSYMPLDPSNGDYFRIAPEFTYTYNEDGTASVQKYVAGELSSRTNVTIPEIVTYGGKTYTVTGTDAGAFDGTNVTRVVVPEGVTVIADNCFANCPDLVEVSLPSSIKTIGANAFSHTAIQSIDIPKDVTSIGDGAFSYMPNLTSIKLYADHPALGNNVFTEGAGETGATVVENVEVSTDNPDAYKDLDQWKDLKWKQVTVGIGGIAAGDDVEGVWTIDGLYIGKDATSLPQGAYVIRKGGKAVKVMVK